MGAELREFPFEDTPRPGPARAGLEPTLLEDLDDTSCLGALLELFARELHRRHELLAVRHLDRTITGRTGGTYGFGFRASSAWISRFVSISA